ncbi:S-adenosylmethionine decarboxylase [Tricharina praecox]|uniref:S-adenosylmethionine decarboxylase n=1 Tax=Tricharina praecox TaxID=43433 RepID=UPI00221EF8E0|nr:S-adenosylmethionine decarboxylase [Tricharina praecox]KAI5854387.1 S-adenosylmethionine decarboxylase [Tricharina praecox]
MPEVSLPLTTYSINHEATIDLDSTNAFEGPEKLLEVWFTPSPELLPMSAQPDGLKSVSEDTWKAMLDIVRCKVLSVVRNEHVDAYLLSESSMFVFPHKLILKTCGTTTLLSGLPELLRIAAQEAGFTDAGEAAATPYRVFYSRKSFMFPQKQMHPHQSWKDEVDFLDRWFGNGSAYMLGRTNGEHWYLYMTTPGSELSPPLTPQSEMEDMEFALHQTETKILHFPGEDEAAIFKNIGGGRDGGSGNGIFDETLEVLMTDLDPVKARQFYLEDASTIAAGQYRKENGDNSADESDDDCGKSIDSGVADLPENLRSEGHALGAIVSEACGLNDAYPRSKYPDACVDSYIFSPCGFSANGVIPSPDPNVTTTHYFTVHVTPEPHCSYASFETNVPGRQSGRETAEILEHVVEIFRPGRFSVTLFEAKPVALESRPGREAFHDMTAARRAHRMDKIKGYKKIDKIVHELDGYDLVFRYYERDDWRGGAKACRGF